jgi:5-hydroxyisourate hydrolase-like protein (transthyretin family)
MKTSAIRAAAALTAVVALVLAGLIAPAGAASDTGRLKGVVSLGGKPVSFAKVQLYRLVYDVSIQEFDLGKRLKTDNTDRKGRYDFAGLTATSSRTSRYIVVVTDRAAKGVRAYRSLVAKKGRTLTENVRLKRAATLTGRIGTVDGRSSAGLTVSVDLDETDDVHGRAYELLLPADHAAVRADGTFTLSGLPAATYDEVRVSDGRHAKQCYDLAGGTLGDCRTVPYADARVTVAAGETRVLPTVTKTTFAPPLSTLTGRVTDTSGTPLRDVEVSVSVPDTGRSGTTVVTRSSGRFTLKDRLEPGTYVVRYHDPRGVYGTATSVGGSIQVSGGGSIRGLDVEMKSATRNRVSFRSGKGFVEATFTLTRRVSGGRPSGTMTLSSAGVSASAPVRKGKVTVRLTGLTEPHRELVAVYSGTRNTAGFTRGFSPK